MHDDGIVVTTVDHPWTGWPDITDPDDRGGSRPSRILVPYNGSLTAQRALDVAAELGAGRSAQVWVLYVRPWDVGRGGFRVSMETRAEALGCAQSAANDLRMRSVSASALVRNARRERIARAIIAEAEVLSAGCIVLGTHARRSFLSALLGSTSLAVARHATRPVIMVKAPTGPRRWPWRRRPR